MQTLIYKPEQHPHNYDRWKIRARYQNSKISKFKPKIKFELETNQFVIKTATTIDELKAVLRLRHEIFIEEGLGEKRNNNLDFSKLDIIADHILLIDKKSHQIVGTYRVLSSGFCDDFYSAKEFHLDHFFASPGLKLELGRACIKKEFRKSMAIDLVWRGIGRYARLTGVDSLFGCTSLKITNEAQALSVLEHLKSNHYSNKFNIKPRFRYQHHTRSKMKPLYEFIPPKDLIPILMKSYLKMGAKIYGIPAYDRDFRCHDFFTIIHVNEIGSKYYNRYFQI